jgi:hypothetical protein
MNFKPIFDSSRMAAVFLAAIFCCGVTWAETFSAAMLAERKPGVDDTTWNTHADFLTGSLAFPVAPTNTTADSSRVRWIWEEADSGEMTANDVRAGLESMVAVFNDPSFSFPSALSLQWGNGSGNGLPVPSDVAATDDGLNEIVVSWNHAEANGYSFDVYRGSTASFDQAAKVGTGIGTSPFSDADVATGEIYYYWVVAIRMNDGEESAPSGFALGAVAEPAAEIPMVTGIRGTRWNPNEYLLSWNELEDPGYHYAVFRDGTEIARTGLPFWSLAGRGMEAGLNYFLSVAAVRVSDGVIGPQSEFVVGSIVGEGSDGKLRIAASNLFGTTGMEQEILVVWSVPVGVEGKAYEIYRSESNQFEQAELVAEEEVEYSQLTGEFLRAPTLYVDTAIETGKAYLYWVVIRDFDGSEIMRSDSDVGFFGEPDADPDCVDPEAGPQLFNIAQRAFVKASNRGGNDQFGYAVALDGDIAVIGAPGEDSSSRGINGQQADENAQQSGAVYVLSRNPQTGAWSQEAYLKAPVTSTGEKAAFGQSVAISGNTVVVGAPGDHDYQGRAYVFIKQGGTWSLQATLAANDPEAFTNMRSIPQFGHAVAIDGETILVGAPYRDAKVESALPAYPFPPGWTDTNLPLQYTGAAYVFTRNSGFWTQRKILIGSNTNQTTMYWVEDPVSIDFRIARFEEMNVLWGCDRRWWETPVNEYRQIPNHILFGFSVALSGRVAVIGSPGDGKFDVGVHNGSYMGCPHSVSRIGSATIFEGAGDVWTQTAYLKTPTLEFETGFGRSLAVNGRTVVVGAPYDGSNATAVNGGYNSSAPLSGAAYVFVSESVGAPWRQQAFLKSTHAAHTTADGKSVWFFGSSLALQGDRLLVAAPTMVRGGCLKSGVAYLFGRQGENWSQQALVRPTVGGDEFDLFGGRHAWDGATGLAMDGDTLVVGAPGEDSSAIGIGGDESTNGAAESGAAYVFSLAEAGSGYAEWASSMGLPPDPALAGEDGNANGVADIFEYLLKLPDGNPASGLPNMVVPATAGAGPQFSFRVAAGSRADAVMNIRFSDTMLAGDWQIIATKDGNYPWSGPSTVTESPHPDGSTIITIEVPAAGQTSTTGYFQFGATLR